MEKRVSIRDIAEMHLSQQLERKKALLLTLELDACARQGIPWTEYHFAEWHLYLAVFSA